MRACTKLATVGIVFHLFSCGCNTITHKAKPSAGTGSATAESGVASKPTQARAADGRYISWREHLIDDPELGGVPISGGDGLQVADLDLDGYLDIVSVHESDTAYDGVPDGYIRIAFGSEDPDRWELATLAEGAEAGAPEDLAIGDLNRDGYPDVVVACELAHLIYFENPGSDVRSAIWKRVIPPVATNRGSFIRVFFADLNGDGELEIVAANKGSQSGGGENGALTPISWFEIVGDALDGANWVEHELIRVYDPRNSRPIDLDGDGDLDVIGSSRASPSSRIFGIFWFENRSRGQIEFVERQFKIVFSSQSDEDPRQQAVRGTHLAFHDLNGDHRLDIVLPQGTSKLAWLEHPLETGGSWRLHQIGAQEPDVLLGFALADINNDGNIDAIAGGYSHGPRGKDGNVTSIDRLGRIAWFENPGDSREPWTRHDISRRKRGMFDVFIPRDMDADGDIDFVSTRGNSAPYDGVFWLEQVRTADPVRSFRRARDVDSAEMPLP